jgi:hypothetical protein
LSISFSTASAIFGLYRFHACSTTPCADPLFTTSNGSHTRCEAVFPGIEVSISTLRCKFPPFGAKLVHPSVNLPVAERLVISHRTVNRHLSNILSKLDVPGRAAAVAYVIRQGLA